MDEIQRVLIKMGRRDLAQKYYEKVAQSDWNWTDPKYSSNLNTSLKKYNVRIGSDNTWMLQKKVNIYKDTFGAIIVTWRIMPVKKGNDWVLTSELSFAPATNGSLANDKFKEFKNLDMVSGEDTFAVFGIYTKTITIVPKDDNDIKTFLNAHEKDYKEAKKYWANIQKQYEVTPTNPRGIKQ